MEIPPREAAVLFIPTNLGASRRVNEMGDISLAAFPPPLVNHAIEQSGVTPVEHIRVSCPLPDYWDTSKLKNIGKITRLSENIANIVEEQRRKGRMIIAIGGDHSLSLGTVAGITAASDGDVGMVIIDRHLDYNTTEHTPSGNIHGMPVAANTGTGDPRLTNIHRTGPKLRPENVLILGVNDPDKNEQRPEEGELERAARDRIGVVTMDEFKAGGRAMENIRNRILALAGRVKQLYVSIDMDGIDQQDAPSNLMANPDGFRAEEAKEIVKMIREAGKPIAGVEVVETGVPSYKGDPEDMITKGQYVSTFGIDAIRTGFVAQDLISEVLKMPAA